LIPATKHTARPCLTAQLTNSINCQAHEWETPRKILVPSHPLPSQLILHNLETVLPIKPFLNCTFFEPNKWLLLFHCAEFEVVSNVGLDNQKEINVFFSLCFNGLICVHDFEHNFPRL
jgi:hypothetical protein